MPRKRLTEEGVRKLKPTPDKQIDYFDQGLPGLVLRVSYGGAKTWRALYYVNRKPRTHKLGRYPILKLDKAREKARAFLEDPQAALARAATGSFKDIAEDFMRRHVEANALRSKAEIERCLNKYILPQWKDRQFVELRRGDVTTLLDDIEDENGPRQADLVLAIVRKMMNWYAARVDDYASPIVRGMQRTKPAERRRKRILDNDEIRALWKATDDTGTFGAIVKVLLLTGQRRRKVAAMRRGDIVDGEWRINSTDREKGHAGALRLPQMVLEIIEAQPSIDGNDYVFAVGGGEGHFNSFSQRKEEIDKLLPDVPAWTIHDLRRTARSLMARAGVRPDIAERVLGHAIAGVEGVYDRHEYSEEKADALKRLAALIGTILNPPEGNVVAIPIRRRRK
jgi:integrase